VYVWEIVKESIKRKTPTQCSAIRLAMTCYLAAQVDLAFSLVVESVLKKDEHLLEDKRLSRRYPLKVTRYCENVSSFVICLVVLPLLC